MLLSLRREASANGWTLGRLHVDGRFDCYTCEDVVREPGVKVPGQTAIPAGRYRIVVNVSPRFTRIAGRPVSMPLLVGVQGFEGIRIHPGNTHKHTEGCILPGLGHNAQGVTDSQPAYDRLLEQIDAALAAGEEVWIEISNAVRRSEPAPEPEPAPVARPRAPVAPPGDPVGG